MSGRSMPGVTVAMACVLALAGCGGPSRPKVTGAQLHERSVADSAEMEAAVRNWAGKLIARTDRKEAESSQGTAVLQILALSGGGDFGAFGAGFLVGWGTVPDPEWRRPDFDVVTGVSTGAMLAPFAFVGTDAACRTVEEFYRNPKSDWMSERGLLFFLPSNPSFVKISGLKRDLAHAVDAELVEKMAERSREGRLLAVSATDLDLGRQKFWDVGTESEAAAASGDPERVEQLLLASAAIPVVLPPVRIGDSIYADGGVTANIFLRLDWRDPNAFIPRWRAAHPGRPFPKVRYWVIINNSLASIPTTVQPRWPDVLVPSLSAAIRSATVSEVRLLAAEADYVNAASAPTSRSAWSRSPMTGARRSRATSRNRRWTPSPTSARKWAPRRPRG